VAFILSYPEITLIYFLFIMGREFLDTSRKMFAARLKDIGESATFKYSRLAKKPGVIDFTQGKTNFMTPKVIVEATKKALDEGKISYTEVKGIVELRKVISEKLREVNNIEGVDENKIIVSCGAKHLIFEALMSLINPHDVVAIPDPSWVSYEAIVKILEGKPQFIKLSEENGYVPDENFYHELENSKAKVLIINSPNNPTGAVYPKKVFEKIIDIAERKDMWIISDEIYERLIYDGSHFSPGSKYEKTITINSFSKEFSMTGWRLGYAACPHSEVIEKMAVVQSQTVSCAVSFIQYGAIKAFSSEAEEEVALMVKKLKERRDLLCKGLKKLGLIRNYPNGAFYVFPKIKGDDFKFSDMLLENQVAVIPGSPFGNEGKSHLRISYGGVSLEEIKIGLERIKKVIEEND